MKEINDIDIETIDGQMLLAAIGLITTTWLTNKTPMQVLEMITKAKDKMQMPEVII